ncbi:MAG TPA: heterodisulfide reductase-related iron-sulfur binding cluster [Gemmatimonadales bacterium]|mgnify:CR=1 FL=1|nr:heterodisulfide reductase-related iron-sulfur binding cluster [Gemmatimonadales bacterium]
MSSEGAAGILAPLAPCVHCGFCLPACPTYLATGDENDSPRGRIVLMRALASGALAPTDPSLGHHLDRCLGCRGCEPACPSGVAYGAGLAAAREQLVEARGLPWTARIILRIFSTPLLWRPLLTMARWFRSTGIPRAFAGNGRLSFSMGMLAATAPPPRSPTAPLPRPGEGPSVVLFTGCVMDTLFTHVHNAARRTLQANGYRVIEVRAQECCGALHEHAGDHEGAVRLARRNLAAFGDTADFIAVDSAGCGALLKEYGQLLGTGDAAAFSARVMDVTELLAARGPRPAGPLSMDVAYDAPCHLQHAQGVHAAPLAVLHAIEGLRFRELPGADRCCGSAGIYSLLEPSLSRDVLETKLAAIRDADPVPSVVATGNPGCLMQIGAGLVADELAVRVVHPVELLDMAYQLNGVYDSPHPAPR